MSLEVEVIKESETPKVLEWEIVERWADGIPVRSENDPDNPEWVATPTTPLDLYPHGGTVHLKNESDKMSNPTQTIKDRAAWELATLYRDYARALYMMKKEHLINGNISSLVVPRLSVITNGNVGRAVSNMFEQYKLPPMKLLVDKKMDRKRLEILKGLHADIYMVDLEERALTPDDVKKATNNENGVDITSVRAFEPQAIFYDWHVHETFNENPDSIYVPYGSGRLMENYLTWQQRTIRNDANGNRDPRLKISAARVASMNVLGAEPSSQRSIADKLTKTFNPFRIFEDHDISAQMSFAFTGPETGIYRVDEDRLAQAQILLQSHGIPAEPSGAAGLALYLQRYDQGKIDPRKKHLVVNTGKGI